MMLKRLLRRDDKGIGAVEFALVAPVFISFIIGVSQVGRMFYANADMKSAMAAGARVASVYPVPEDDVIIAAVRARLMRDGADARATPTVVRGVDANGNPFVELKMSYSVPLEFIFFNTPAVTLHDSRTVFTQVETALVNNEDDSPSSTTSTTSASTSASTSSTSASSSGDASTSTSSTSSGDASTSSTTSASSSGNNGSSGSNNGSSGHAHGDDCHKC